MRVIYVVETTLRFGATSRTTWPTMDLAYRAAAKLASEGFKASVTAFAVDL